MTLFKLSAMIMAVIIGLACPPLLIPAAAFIWFMIDRQRAHSRKIDEARRAVADIIAERERQKAVRYFAR